MLTRPLYRGQVVWNLSKKRNAWGQKHQVARADQDWVLVDAPDLRIIPESLWEAVQGRLKTSRQCYLRSTNGQLWGRPGNGIESRYLLTGLAQCGRCGGSLIVHSRPSGRTRRAVYTCSYHHLRGTTVCPNGDVLPMEAANHAVLATIEAEVLHPTVVARTVEKLLEQLKPTADTLVPRRTALRVELVTLEHELARLTTAVAQGGDLTTLVKGVQARDQRRRSLQEELARLDVSTAPRISSPGRSSARQRSGWLTTRASLPGIPRRPDRSSRRSSWGGSCSSPRTVAATSSAARRPWAGS
jgi:site-specific DNA recombinase